MQYQQFLEAVRQEVELRAEPSCNVSLIQVPKNNGRLMDGLVFLNSDTRFSPAIYLNSFYNDFQSGTSVSQIAQTLLEIYETEKAQEPQTFGDFSSISAVQEQLVFRLVNTAANQELLKTLPHRDFLDLSIIYYLLVDSSNDRLLTSAISYNHMETWNISEETLYQLAMTNTPRLLPARLDSMDDVMNELSQGTVSLPEEPSNLYVLTNSRGLNGDSCLLYPDILKDFAKRMENDIIILPSSVHEVLLLPYEPSIQFEELNRMVTSINQAEVPLEDRLADHVYLFSGETNEFSIPNPQL